MDLNDFVTMFFLVAAVLIFLQLRNVLGRRTGNEKPPYDPYSARDASKDLDGSDDSKVVTLPKRGEVSEENRFADIDSVAPVGSKVNDGLRQILERDLSFNAKQFSQGAKSAYEMIVMGFATGDRETLQSLLSAEVYEGFDLVITEREARGEVTRSTFVGIEKAEIIEAGVSGDEANVTLRIASQLISATFDAEGKVVDGDADNVMDVNDVWTFSRDLRSRDPNWKLVATESE
jgi:predicted lipid-binding transport protein (Tim44 family)